MAYVVHIDLDTPDKIMALTLKDAVLGIEEATLCNWDLAVYEEKNCYITCIVQFPISG